MGENMVHHPRHYTQGVLPGECLDYVSHCDFMRGNAVKYLWRFNKKNGIEDIEKALFYVNALHDNPTLCVGTVPKEKLTTIVEDAVDITKDEGILREEKQAVAAIITLLSMSDEDDSASRDMSLHLARNAIHSIVEAIEDGYGEDEDSDSDTILADIHIFPAP